MNEISGYFTIFILYLNIFQFCKQRYINNLKVNYKCHCFNDMSDLSRAMIYFRPKQSQDWFDKLELTGVNEKTGLFGGITMFAESPT